MTDVLMLLLFLVAIGSGWWLGRRSAAAATPDLPGPYYRGLNYLLDGHPNGAIDAFVDALEVNTETLDTHITLGNLLRRRGEVDRAIRIHQNLLARPSLSRAQAHMAHLELARDYISAGLYDRAERLLRDLVTTSPEQRRAARRHLLEILQSEREWAEAIEVATALLPRRALLGPPPAAPRGANGQSVAVALAHYHCELAAELLAQDDVPAARRQLRQALASDRRCVRASLMLGELEVRAGNHREACRILCGVRQQDPDFVAETIPLLRICHEQLGDPRGLRRYLDECLQDSPVTPLVLAVAEDIRAASGAAAAADFLAGQMARSPSLAGLARLVGLQGQVVEGALRDNLAMLARLFDRLLAEEPVYRCSHCGFAGRQLHWFCPGCKHWGTIKPLRANRSG